MRTPDSYSQKVPGFISFAQGAESRRSGGDNGGMPAYYTAMAEVV